MLVFLLKIIEKCEIVLSRPTEYFRIPRLHYLLRSGTFPFRDCTTSAHIVLPHSEIVLSRPTEYFRTSRVYYIGRQSTSAF